jgi:hypothetical protein
MPTRNDNRDPRTLLGDGTGNRDGNRPRRGGQQQRPPGARNAPRGDSRGENRGGRGGGGQRPPGARSDGAGNRRGGNPQQPPRGPRPQNPEDIDDNIGNVLHPPSAPRAIAKPPVDDNFAPEDNTYSNQPHLTLHQTAEPQKKEGAWSPMKRAGRQVAAILGGFRKSK